MKGEVIAKSKLDPVAQTFYGKLLPTDYPYALIDAHPRIANRIVSLLLDDKAALGPYFEELLTVKRVGRRGFPFPVLANIQNLYDLLVGIPDGFVDTDLLYNKPVLD
jgi:hypothetical protein